LDSNGIKNSVAICGTAFSKNHFLKLSRYTDKITFVLDRDDGGGKSMEQIYNKFCNKGIKLRFLLLPEDCKDVDQYFSSSKTAEDFARDLEQFIPNW
jgi:DNA primase